MRNHHLANERVEVVADTTKEDPAKGDSSRLILRECFELFHSTCTGLAKLSIDTSNDLFEMDPRVSQDEVYEFRSKRGEWLTRFDNSLRELFEKRLSGERRKGRRPDSVQSVDSLRVMNDSDTNKQSALGQLSTRLTKAGKQEFEALDYRVCALFGEPPTAEFDNPFSPSYLLDAIGMTSRSLYVEARIWQPLMERVGGDFVPAINKTYIQLNRFLAEQRVLPEIGAALRARSDLRPADDRHLLPLFGRLLNDIHPSMQAWCTLEWGTATAAGYALAPLPANPYTAAVEIPSQSTIKVAADAFPRLDAMLAAGTIAGVLETLDRWQRADPMDEYLRSTALPGIEPEVTPVNRIPWIRAAIASQITGEGEKAAIDVVGFLFNYIFRDTSIPPRFRMILGGLQIPIVKVALADPGYFVQTSHPARRLLDELAATAVGADEDEQYGKAFETFARSLIDIVRAKFVLEASVFEGACAALKSFNDHWHKKVAAAMQRYVDAGLTSEWHDAHRSRVRVLIRAKLAGADIPIDVRGFIGTVWAEYMTLLRQANGTQSDSYIAAVEAMDDMLWSIAVKARKGQKVKLAKMVPALVRSLRAGGAAVQAPEDKTQRFLSALYDLHISAIRPGAATSVDDRRTGALSLLADKQIVNLHDFVADLVEGTWLAFDQDGIRVPARLSWISPWRATYIFATPSGSTVMVFSPEDLAWEMNNGKVALILEPVPLFDRAVSVSLEYLAQCGAPAAEGDRSMPQVSGESVGTAT